VAIALEPAEAFAAIVVLIIAADGRLAPDELSLLDTTLSRMHLFRGYPPDFLHQTFAKLCDLLLAVGATALLEAALAALPRDLYDTTYAIALDLALADDAIDSEEQQILDRLQAATGLPQTTVDLLGQAMAIKHKG